MATISSFNEYTIRADISVNRKDGGYYGQKIADVTVEETISIGSDQDVELETNRIISEARDKVLRSMDIRQTAERKLLELESGSAVIDA